SCRHRVGGSRYWVGAPFAARTSARARVAFHCGPSSRTGVARLFDACPQVTLDFMVTNRIVDVVGENLDISLRMGGLNDSTLVARKIADLPRIVCASPSYLARHGRPVKPADLAHHSCLTLSRNPGSATWPFRVDGQLVQVDVKGPVSADSTDMLVGLAIEGAGILRLSEHVVGEAIENGQLEPILQESDHCVGKHFDWSWTS